MLSDPRTEYQIARARHAERLAGAAGRRFVAELDCRGPRFLHGVAISLRLIANLVEPVDRESAPWPPRTAQPDVPAASLRGRIRGR